MLNFTRIIRLFLPIDEAESSTRLINAGVGCSDKAWNMLAANRQMHHWWSKACWGFRLVGVTPEGSGPLHVVRLRFQWLQKKRPDPMWHINIDANSDGILRMLDELAEVHGMGQGAGMQGFIMAHQCKSGWRLRSGQDF